MRDQILQYRSRAESVAPPLRGLPLGRCLIAEGTITEAQLAHALDLQRRLDAPLGEILVAEGWAAPGDVLRALSRQTGLQIADLEVSKPQAGLCQSQPVQFWLRHGVVPWMRFGPLLLVATSRPDRFEPVRATLSSDGLTVVPVLASPEQIDAALILRHSGELAKMAETRVQKEMSCRDWSLVSRLPTLTVVALLGAVCIMAPQWALVTLFAIAVLTLLLFLALRVAGFASFAATRSRQGEIPDGTAIVPQRLPSMSILVPLFREREIADALIHRLRRLSYPKALLDVILVLEEQDSVTREALEGVDLPHWMRVIEVPALNGLTTKPRAMNYALNFCRGEILGVWDAEDAPAPDQLERVATRFASVPQDVVCLQGVLDYYNPRSNWRSRCFTIEYNSWFRVILPGIARLGLVVPLGGTTFFFRRKVLEQLGGWDAHNVTEDADLGVRLCRAGYRTDIVDTATYEEANFRAWPWIRQRSRWLKGFMVTYLVHMRAPRRLLAELGLWRFLGVQAFFLGTLGQFLLAPVLWLFWPLLFGLPQPLDGLLSPQVFQVCALLFLGAELVNIAVGTLAVALARRKYLIAWLPVMIVYFPFGVIAAYKAVWELLVKPYFWDKTQHGQAREEQVHETAQ